MHITYQSRFFYVFFLCSTIFTDQFFKSLAHQQGLVTLNKGISLSILALDQQWVLVSLTIFAIVTLTYLFRQLWIQYWGWHAVLFGATSSNILDRLIWGGVQDYLPIPFTNIHNNLADWVIAICLFFLMVKLFLHQDNGYSSLT